MKISEAPTCSHCNETMKKMAMPPEAGYDDPFVYICFNDDCPYFVEGWEWMYEKYGVRSSYRQMINPLTEIANPLPVWSYTAMQDRIIA